MKTKIYKAVHDLAQKMMRAANRQDQAQFDPLYAELQAICIDNENISNKDHPVQWETLADFTEDLEQALIIYEKALAKAVAINAKDFMSSIPFSMATLQAELGQTEAAIQTLRFAQDSAKNIVDKELKNEIDALLKTLTEASAV